MTRRTKFRILNFNANGIYQDRLTLQELLHSLDVDVALICETKVPVWFQWRVPGYKVYNTRGPNPPFGGTAVLVKANITHALVDIPRLISLQATAIKIELEGFETVIGALYQSPSKPLEGNDFDTIIGLSLIGKFIFGGDLNSKHRLWNSRLTNTRGRRLLEHADRNNYSISAPDSPTHYPSRLNALPDVLDIFLHHTSLNVSDVVTLDELNSDHNPVLLTVDSALPAQILNRPSDKEVRWDAYREYLKPINFPSDEYHSIDALETGIEAFSNTLVSARRTGEVNRPQEALQHFPDLSDLIVEKRQARRRWQKYKQRKDKVEFNRLTNLIHKLIRDYRISRFEADIQEASNSKSVWKLANRVKASRGNTNTPIHGLNGVKYDAIGKATAVAECLEDQFKPNDYEDDFHDHYKQVRRGVEAFRNTEFESSIKEVTGNEVRTIIKRLKHKKSPGHDGVNNSMLKQLPCNCIHHLTAIYNSALKLQHFPINWKKAQVITIPKPGKDPKFPQNRRPISLLSTLGKIYERVLLNRLMEFVEERKLIPEEQFGFMAGCSTTHQLLRLMESITEGFQTRQTTIAVFLDISKAYDTTWHTGLIYKLIGMGLPGDLIKIIESFLSQRSFRVRMDGAHSEWKNLKAGVPQGAVLSPILYNLYTSDIPMAESTQTAIYADDICIFNTCKNPKHSQRAVQWQLTEIGKWSQKWRIRVSPEKTNAVAFSKRRRLTLAKLKLHDEEIDYVSTCKYLGVTLDHRLKWRPHCEVLRAKASSSLRALRPLMTSNLPRRLKLLIYKTYIRPQMTHAAPAWAFTPNYIMDRLQAVQNRALRVIGGYDYYTRITKIHFDTEIPMLRAYIKHLAQNFYKNAKLSTNSYINRLGRTARSHRPRSLRPINILS